MLWSFGCGPWKVLGRCLWDHCGLSERGFQRGIPGLLRIKTGKFTTFRAHSHFTTATQIFDVVTMSSEMGCIFTNVTARTWQQQQKKHCCRQVQTVPQGTFTPVIYSVWAFVWTYSHSASWALCNWELFIAGSLESAYSLIWGSHEIWGQGGGESLTLLW